MTHQRDMIRHRKARAQAIAATESTSARLLGLSLPFAAALLLLAGLASL
ncbi:MAG: hypothetical protein ABF335_02865 [Alphaproteobacteria bacterium]